MYTRAPEEEISEVNKIKNVALTSLHNSYTHNNF